MPPLRLLTRFRFDSPAFLGGAGTDAEAELRAAPWKGALRFWLRALIAPSLPGDGAWQRRERQWCGAHPVAGRGEEAAGAAARSPWSVRVRPMGDLPASWRFDPAAYKGAQRVVHADGRAPTSWIGGVPYCLYPLDLPGNRQRRGFAPGAEVEVELVVLRPDEEQHAVGGPLGLGTQGRRALLGAVWLLGHLGAVGMRASRGAGSVSLTGWEVQTLAQWRARRGGVGRGPAGGGPSTGDGPEAAADAWTEDLAALPLGAATQDAKAWVAAVRRGLDTLAGWFPARREPATPCLDRRARIVLVPDGPHRDVRSAPSPRGGGRRLAPWERALDAAGGRLQLFRRRDAASRRLVLGQLLADAGHRDGAPLRELPPRAGFGLPLTFRFAKAPRRYPQVRGSQLDLRPDLDRQLGDRFASNLRLRIIAAGAERRALFVRLGGALPGDPAPAEGERGGEGVDYTAGRFETRRSDRGRVHSERGGLRMTPGAAALDGFLDEVAAERGATRVWAGGRGAGPRKGRGSR